MAGWSPWQKSCFVYSTSDSLHPRRNITRLSGLQFSPFPLGLPECCVFTGPPTVTPELQSQSPFSGVPAADAPAPASATVQSPGSKGSSKRHKLTACALAIMGLRQLPEAQGTAKQITAAVEADSALAQHLNW